MSTETGKYITSRDFGFANGSEPYDKDAMAQHAQWILTIMLEKSNRSRSPVDLGYYRVSHNVLSAMEEAGLVRKVVRDQYVLEDPDGVGVYI